jgi:dipeptidyl aminopeptidase/acylaminoacyl peptidase
MMGAKAVKPYGLWPSPISPTMMGLKLRLGDPQWDSDGRSLLWLESRSDRSVLVCQAGSEGARDLSEEHNPHGGVGYGGGDYSVSHGAVIFAERNGRLYRRSLGCDAPCAITPPFGETASPVLSPDGRWVAYVHTCERKDVIGLVDSRGNSWPVKLVQGADFYMQPTWHPQGSYLTWVEWDHPNMPWDGSRLMLGRFSGDTPTLTDIHSLAGGDEIPVFQPAFSPDGRWLSCITGEGEWEQLLLIDLDSGERRVLVEGATLSTPAWNQGLRTYGWNYTSQRLYYLRNDAGFASLWQVELESGVSTCIELGSYNSLAQLSVSPVEEKLAVLASAPSVPTRLITWQAGQVQVTRRSEGENTDPADLPTPQPLSWTAADGSAIHGLYYLPTSSRFAGSGLPPAVIHIHGGPTSQSTAGYSADTAFFTSRGYAFLAVNYRGSTGYGRSYRLALRQRWGEVDVEDAVSGARALVDRGLADPTRLVIRGGSAGGYTVLNALVRFPGLFKAGVCSYGVSNLFNLARDTHKFEERYTDSLVGPLPETAARYREWSPIFKAEHIQDALALFQGSEDKVVLPDQSEAIAAVLRSRHVPHIYHLFPGEGHGFRKGENIAAFYDEVDQFLQQYVVMG